MTARPEDDPRDPDPVADADAADADATGPVDPMLGQPLTDPITGRFGAGPIQSGDAGPSDVAETDPDLADVIEQPESGALSGSAYPSDRPAGGGPLGTDEADTVTRGRWPVVAGVFILAVAFLLMLYLFR